MYRGIIDCVCSDLKGKNCKVNEKCSWNMLKLSFLDDIYTWKSKRNYQSSPWDKTWGMVSRNLWRFDRRSFTKTNDTWRSHQPRQLLDCLQTGTSRFEIHTYLFPRRSKKNNNLFTHCFIFQLHRGLQERASRRTSLLLQMDQISSKLSNLRSTTIAMPGISSQNKVVTIEGVSNHVQILPTKTKPKKLVFLGSDGKR